MKPEWGGKTLHCYPRDGSSNYLRHCTCHFSSLCTLTVSRRK
jgi:hypothetical protein